jgi:hypothetical protein
LHSNALDRYLAVGILRLQEGLDYSGIIQDEEFVPISKLNRKDAEEKMRRNESTNRLVPQGNHRENCISPCKIE